MKIEPSGVILTGVCEVQTPVCQAREPAPITAVWTLPARTQTNVCRACLEQQVRDGVWEIPGARIQQRYDVAVLDHAARTQLVVEVKSHHPGGVRPAVEWATTIHRNLVQHAGIPTAPAFLLVGYPGSFFVWGSSGRPETARTPDYIYFDEAILQPYRDALGDDENPERVVVAWLEDVLHDDHRVHLGNGGNASAALRSLLSRITRGGTVVRQAAAA